MTIRKPFVKVTCLKPKRISAFLICYLAIFALIFTSTTIFAETLDGRIVGVSDGDTVTLLTTANQQIKIRLAQIDAPEKDQDFGQRSKQSLSDLVFGKTVRIEKETIDKYGRTVGTIFVDGIDANKEQVKRGMAWAYRQYLTDQSIIEIESQAKNSHIGLWSINNPTPPWDFRHSKKGSPSTLNATLLVREASLSDKPKINNGTCGEKRYCKEMTSCDEAMYYLKTCGLSRLDGDSDGVPCESLCRK